MNKVVSYLWQDESRHFMEEGALADSHIFVDLIKAQVYLWRLEGHADKPQHSLRDYMYAESPYDLASEEDNAYRNLVDNLIK